VGTVAGMKPSHVVLALKQFDCLIVDEAYAAERYYFIKGVPGSGKTSVVIKNLAKRIVNNGQNVLLLAYTNNATDQLCQQMIQLKEEGMNFGLVRLGRESVMAEDVLPFSLNNQIETVENRNQLGEYIENVKVFVGTVAGMKPSHVVLALKQFDCLIVDEASQVLEPSIIGLLTKFPKFVMIGDHNQLPAISLQEKGATHLEDNDELSQQIGLVNLSNSYFERMYMLCERNSWNDCIGELTVQGRMNEELMVFPSHTFYKGALSVLDQLRQKGGELVVTNQPHTDLQVVLSKKRLAFLHTERDIHNNLKTNAQEANLVKQIVEDIHTLNGEDFEILMRLMH